MQIIRRIDLLAHFLAKSFLPRFSSLCHNQQLSALICIMSFVRPLFTILKGTHQPEILGNGFPITPSTRALLGARARSCLQLQASVHFVLHVETTPLCRQLP